jgi:hypothetical protein
VRSIPSHMPLPDRNMDPPDIRTGTCPCCFGETQNFDIFCDGDHSGSCRKLCQTPTACDDCLRRCAGCGERGGSKLELDHPICQVCHVEGVILHPCGGWHIPGECNTCEREP